MTRRRQLRGSRQLVLALLPVAFTQLDTGCAAGGAGQSHPPQRAPQTRPARDPGGVESFLRGFAKNFPKHFNRSVSSSKAVATHAGLHLSIAEPDEFHEPKVLEEVYGAQGTKTRFVRLTKLTEAGQLLLKHLAGASAHGLDPQRYHLPALRERIAAHTSSAEALESVHAPAPPSAMERQKLRALLMSRTDIELRTPRAVARVMRILTQPKSPLPRVAKAFASAKKALQPQIEASARLELLLADGLLRYVRDMHRGNTSPVAIRARRRMEDAQARSNPESETEETSEADDDVVGTDDGDSNAPLPLILRDPAAYVQEALREDLQGVRDAQTLGKLLGQLEPRHPQYRRLMTALEHYRAIVEAGGWPKLRASRWLRPGRRHRAVPQLKRRLASEGYYEGSTNDRYDDALTRAVREYQQTHQLESTGRTKGRAFWRSLNVPAANRARAIELTLQRWRESRIGTDDHYAFINIPDYHLEIWRSGERVARHKLVVGRARKKYCSEKTRRQMLAYATPTQSARIKTLVFAPHWNVTRGIKEEEFDPKRGMDPLFYQKNGYQIIGQGHAERVRELPGPGNALGFVKFIFPNRYNTYVHDSPLKQLFKRRIRAFSHGCMRAQNPRDLARVVLEADGQWDEARYAHLYRKWRRMSFDRLKKAWNPALYKKLRNRATALETTVTLREPLPIHIEYYTVRVDEHERTHFLYDVYGRDRQRLYPRTARRCIPDSVLARRNFAATLTRVDTLQEEAKALQTCVDNAGPLSEKLAAERSARIKRLRRQLTKLEQLPEHHGNLSQRIRDEHTALAEQLEARSGRWKRRLVTRALRIERLVKALATMTHHAKSTCSAAEKAAAPPSLSALMPSITSP